MSRIPRRRYWPYDEVSASRDPLSPTRFLINSPWLSFHVDIDPQHVDRAERITQKLAAGEITPEDLQDLNWFFSSLSQFPLSYILPRAEGFGEDAHQVRGPHAQSTTPREMLLGLTKDSACKSEVKALAEGVLKPLSWSWDATAALQFSQTESGYDPETLFSIARRFHLLNDLEWNQTAEMLDYVATLKESREEFRRASALIARQNHYITEKCDPVLRAALPISQSAFEAVNEFIQAESGHDKIVAKAIKALGSDPADVPLIDSVVVLMEVFRLAASKNLLAFSMIVDIFERTSYQDDDPFASVLEAGGETAAAKQIDVHREINDAGEHENVALEFVSHMAPVDEAYALEALQLAELATLVIHQMSAETLKLLKKAG